MRKLGRKENKRKEETRRGGGKLQDWEESFVPHLKSSRSKDEQGSANAINYAQF